MDTSGIGKGAGALIGQMFKKDANGDAKLSQAEYKSFLASKSGNAGISDAAAAASFKQIDADGDGDGSLSKSEVESFFTAPSVSAPMDAVTTSSLFDALSAENTASANTSPDLLTQLLASYTAAQKKLGGTFSGDA